MKKEKYKVLLTTSGLGQRLGELTKYTNKALIRVGKKPVISHIIESYDKDIEFVITVGYFGEQIKDFLKITYPERKFTFVDIDKYQGEGSSLGYSMLQAKKHLNCPFIFHASDTIVKGKIPPPDYNWNGGFISRNSSQYSTFSIIRNVVQQVNDKGAIDYDYIHIGLVGIRDFKSFWYHLEAAYLGALNDPTLNDCKAMNLMIRDGINFLVKEFKDWYDTGNVDGLNKAREELGESFNNLDKPGEAVYLFEKFVIKFYHDEEIINQKLQRAKLLNNIAPPIEKNIRNFFRYKFVKGDLYSNVATSSDFRKFLNWSKKNLWIKNNKIEKDNFKEVCRKFYLDKTLKRVEQFLNQTKLEDREMLINGEKVPSFKKLIEQIDFNWLSDGLPVNFHGDMVLENIIKTGNGYKLIDWRQNFGGIIEAGDIYYDLAKLNHNLIVNHELVDKKYYISSRINGEIKVDILRHHNLVSCQNELFKFIEQEGLDKKKVLVLTALIWLNMAPLHPIPENFNLFLFNFGKYNLHQALKDNQ